MKDENRKDNYIKLPAHVILTREGIGVVSRSNLKVVRVTGSEGFKKEGIDAGSFNGQTLQKMVMNSFVEEVLINAPEFLKHRYEIISTNNLVVYAILYKKLTPSVSEMFFHSSVVKQFNRKNPKNSIVDIHQINQKVLDDLMNKQSAIFDQMKQEIYSEVVEKINANPQLSEEDKLLEIKALPKFIAWIDSRIWYLYYIVYQTSFKESILMDFAGIVALYLKRTHLSVHLSNLLMELVQNAERAHFERVVVRNHLCPPGEVDKYIRKKENREKVSQICKENDELLQLAWNMNPERNSIGKQYRLKIAVSNYGLLDEITRTSINSKMNANVEGISLAEFYTTSEDSKLGAGLGLLYNSYLEDYCRSEGIQYRCNIMPELKKEKTTVNLEIAF